MSETTEIISQPSSNQSLDVEYFLKEFDFHVAIETKARDRTENMVQYLLTTIAAIIGAVLLVNEMKANNILLLFVASFLVFTVSTSVFYRACRLRYIITYARVIRNNIRCILKGFGIRETDRLVEWEGNQSGFSNRMQINLTLFMSICSLLGGVTGVLGLMLVFQVSEWPVRITSSQQVLLIVIPICLVILIGVTLELILVNLKNKADRLITDPAWKSLPDYEL